MPEIFKQKPEVKKRVYEAIPITGKERRCRMEKQKADWKRFEMAKKLYNHPEN